MLLSYKGTTAALQAGKVAVARDGKRYTFDLNADGPSDTTWDRLYIDGDEQLGEE